MSLMDCPPNTSDHTQPSVSQSNLSPTPIFRMICFIFTGIDSSSAIDLRSYNKIYRKVRGYYYHLQK